MKTATKSSENEKAQVLCDAGRYYGSHGSCPEIPSRLVYGHEPCVQHLVHQRLKMKPLAATQGLCVFIKPVALMLPACKLPVNQTALAALQTWMVCASGPHSKYEKRLMQPGHIVHAL